ncbi:TIGR02452 family protein [Streptomyces sp. NBC_00878]|uniref:TIGR02452 family protein n=1 Tax=Streptomyces sp. NBC_00878 TaxID=2975854 RepID=UPI00225898AE|nr:TIGR02452 family protein [Streptomyces sp. NBC_00878]MCX4903296.1 TIGR02452 family protein [Streptomyces sp. NBC_00878]
MSARLREIARQTEEIVAAGSYRASDGREVSIAAAVTAARQGTRMYGPGPVEIPPISPVETPRAGPADASPTGPAGASPTSPADASWPSRAALPQLSPVAPSQPSPAGPSPVGPPDTFFEVTGESSLEAARRLPGPVAVLNFASARNPGGGYLNGAQAQEEALCRASALYACVAGVREFYDHHRTHRDAFYTDRVIHSPAVPVFRDDRGQLLDEPYTAGFLTSAAPNAGVVLRTAPERAPELPGALASRAERVLETAAAHGYRRLVLGAWGCGVFRHDPAQVAGAFRTLLTDGGRFADSFEHIVFGVLDRTKGAVVRSAFERAFLEVLETKGAQRQP